jgi:RNA polymerase sigma-70 factor (ECF subfamily)
MIPVAQPSAPRPKETRPMEQRAFISSGPQSGAFLISSTSASSDEETLLARLLADEQAAWREFSARYSRLLLSCISRITARFGYSSTDDVQEIYAALCLQLLSNDKRKLRSFEPGRGTRLGTWLGLLASHAAYDFLRSVRRTPKLDELSGAECVCTELPDPSEATLLRERAQLLAEALSELSDKDRQFVELYYGRGLSPEEVAERMGIQVKTVYTKKHKLQGRLQSLLGDQLLAA